MPQFEDLTKPVSHGGDIVVTARQLGCRPADLIDMSSNLTPLGTDPSLLDHLAAQLPEIGYLPDSDSRQLISIFSQLYRRETGQILAGSGTTEFIFAIPAVIRAEKALIVGPTYSDYQTACNWARLPAEFYLPPATDEFRPDLRVLAKKIIGNELVFICNPNNPTGGVLSSSTLHSFIADHPGSFFVIDESYLPFCEEPSLLSMPQLENLFILNSFSKVYGIPGLRLGFLTASESQIKRLATHRRPWGITRLAQLAGEYLLRHGEEIRQSLLTFLKKERPEFIRQLKELPGTEVIDGAAHFILCRLTGKTDAESLRQGLLKKRIMIRNCHNFTGLDGRYFRVSMRQPQENRLFFKEIPSLLHP